jgi:hypothetical protein
LRKKAIGASLKQQAIVQAKCSHYNVALGAMGLFLHAR